MSAQVTAVYQYIWSGVVSELSVDRIYFTPATERLIWGLQQPPESKLKLPQPSFLVHSFCHLITQQCDFFVFGERVGLVYKWKLMLGGRGQP